MFDTFKNRLELTGTLTTVTALRISAGRSSEPIGSDLPVIKDAFGRPLIPGSSFKGAMRSRLESFLRGIREDLAVDPGELTESDWQNRIKALKEQYKNNDAMLTTEILKPENTDMVSHLFGSPWLAGKFQVRDLTVQADAWFGQYQERDGVAIDRDTETAADGKLYDYQVVPAGTPFEFRAIVENAEEWELGLLRIGLHQFKTEQIPLGGGRSRGLGVVRLENLMLKWFDARVDGDPTQTDPNKLIQYLKKITGVEVEGKPAYVDVSKQQCDQWIRQLIDYLEQRSSLQSPQQVVTEVSTVEES
ncbi:MAG: CRISPR-associated RAMP protein [Leptolyngbyaceae cyanobacterium SU_3_3]|nr:CRISPR-associated RAMP protein [Leptolyngbyaceae cyanobacterium SU_3_3]